MSSTTPSTFESTDHAQLNSLLQQVNDLLQESPATERRRSLLNAFLNLALIPDADFIAAQPNRTTTLTVLYEDILLWDGLAEPA